MNILSKISIKNLKLNKKRTISTIIGIILSSALICAVATLVTSFQTTLVDNTINQTGYYHMKISDVTDDDIKTLENNRDIKDIFTIYETGYGKLENGQNEYKPYLKLYSMNNEVFEKLKFNLTEGRFPTNENEVIISEHIINNGKVDYKIGDKININVGARRTLDDYELNYNNLYNEGDEQLVNTTYFEFSIVGVIKRPNYSFEGYSDPGYTIISTNISQGNKNVYISLKNPREYKKDIANILGAKDYNQVEEAELMEQEPLKYDKYSINKELLRLEAFAVSDDTIAMLYAVAGIVIFIIMFTSVFCIRNSFAIATTEKMKMYGMLSSVGATKKQIRKNVIFEALILGLIGIPLGILSGIFAAFVLIKIVNILIGEYLLNHIDGIVVKISILPILISAILGIITIYLSAMSSARKASKVSPIDLLRNSQDIKINSKKLKTPKIIKKVFKTGGVLAYKNLKRSKKKYRTTVISLAVSIFIFITMSSFLVNAFDLSNNYYEDYDYNIMIYCRGHEQEDVDKIKKLNNIDECFMVYANEKLLRINDLSKINEIEEIYFETDEQNDEEKYLGMRVVALDNETWNKYVKKIGMNPNKIKNEAILCDKYLYYDESGKQIETRTYKYSKGDTITGKLNNEETSFKVGAVTDIKPYGTENSYYIGGDLIVNLDNYKNMNFIPTYMAIQSSNVDKLVEQMKNENIDVGYSNFAQQAKEEKAMILVIKIFLYGFIAVITLIGVTNIFNTITSNMELRQKEFAMLKSIGMTKNEFNRMINLETIFYCTKALFYGIALGLLGTFALYKAFSIKLESGMYIPIKPIIISVIAVFVLVFVIMKYSMNKINKQNTIETIRNENI